MINLFYFYLFLFYSLFIHWTVIIKIVKSLSEGNPQKAKENSPSIKTEEEKKRKEKSMGKGNEKEVKEDKEQQQSWVEED